jgi:hypothetical protein
MRILDEDSDRKVDRVTILLTRDEAEQLQRAVTNVLTDKAYDHDHVIPEDPQKEIIIAIYDDADLSSFNERCQRLILKDE